MSFVSRSGFVLVIVGFAALAQQPVSPDLDYSSSEMRPLIEAFLADRGNLTRTYRIEGSQIRQERFQKFYQDWSARLGAMKFESMSQDGKVDYVLLKNYLGHELRQLELNAAELANTASYVSFAQAVLGFEEARRRMEPVDAKTAAAALSALAKQIDDQRGKIATQFRGGNSPNQNQRIEGDRAARRVASLRNTLRGWFGFYNGYDPMFTWWAEQSYRGVDAALQRYENVLRERVAGLRPKAEPDSTPGQGGRSQQSAAVARPGETDDIVGNPIGREGLMNELAFEMIPYTPEELIAVAEKQFAWCENEMKRASREMGFGDDWKKALEKVKTMHVEPGKQPEMILGLAKEAEKFLDDHNLITIPALARETWRMEMMSPERQLVNPFFLGGESIIVSFPTNTMSYEQKMMSMRGNNIPMSRATVFHELIPGHHLQGFMASRFKPYRNGIGGTPFITEGWSLYWELLLWDMKFQKTPEDRVGALFWRMHRCARIIFSLNFHLSKMSPDECINFLVERVGHERENATGEVRRSFGGGYGPLYQAAYLLGGMQLYSLHKDLVDSGKMTNKQFHDAVLRENRIPVELIRASLMKQPLNRDYKSSWRAFETN